MFETSFFVNFLNKFYMFLGAVLKSSLVGRAWYGMLKIFKKYSNGSFFVKLFGQSITRLNLNETSFIYRVVDRLVNFLPLQLKKLYKRFEPIFKDSMFFKLLILLTRNLSALIAIFMVFVLIVPHKTSFIEWNNKYSTFGVILFFILFLIKTMVEDDTRLQVKAINAFFYIFMIIVIAGQIFSFDALLSLRFFVFYITCFLLVLIMVSSIKNREQLSTFIEIVLVGVTLCGIYGLYKCVKGVPVIVF